MKVENPPSLDVTARQRNAVIREWLARTIRTYPEQTSRFLFKDEDPFRNPVGRALKEGLPVIFDEITGDFTTDRIRLFLDEIVRIRTVQDFTASQAVEFLFFLKPIVRDEIKCSEAGLAVLDRRIDETTLLAFDLYTQCREKIHEVRAGETRRRVYMLERAATTGQP